MASTTRITELLDDLNDSVGKGLILSPQWYRDDEIFEIEREVVFRHTWQYVGPVDKVANPKDFITAMVGGVPIVVVRDQSGALRAYINVCRHRACVVMQDDRGSASSLQCPYHAWTWNLAGELIGVPRASRESEFNAADYPLVPVAVDTWNQLIFVNLDTNAEALADLVGGLDAQIREAGHDMQEYELRADSPHNQDVRVATNWKLMVENNLECYHCSVMHSRDAAYFCFNNPDEYTIVTGPSWSYQLLKDRELGPGKEKPYPLFGPLEFCTFYPNVQIMFLPQAMSVSHYVPVEPGVTKLRRDVFYLPGTSEADIEGTAAWFSQVFQEDTDAMVNTYIGQASGAVRGGPLLLDSEVLLRDLHAVIRDTFSAEMERRGRSTEAEQADLAPTRG